MLSTIYASFLAYHNGNDLHRKPWVFCWLKNPNQISGFTEAFHPLLLIYPLVIKHSHGIDGPFIDGLPIKKGDFPWLC
jgi:hypothetical protein